MAAFGIMQGDYENIETIIEDVDYWWCSLEQYEKNDILSCIDNMYFGDHFYLAGYDAILKGISEDGKPVFDITVH